MVITQAINRSVELYADNAATVFEGRTRSWRDLLGHVKQFAAALRELGVQDGDRVAVLSLNSDSYLECFFSIPWAGAVIVPINTRWSVAEIAYCLEDSEVKVLIIDKQHIPLLEELSDTVKERLTVITTGDVEGSSIDYNYTILLKSHAPIPPRPRDEDTLAGIFYTGGTTGKAKGVMLTDRNLMANALHVILEFGYRPGAVYLHAPPMFHAADAASIYGLSMLGGTHAIIGRFEPLAVLSAVEDWRVNFVLLVPTMLTMLLNEPGFANYQLTSLTRIIYGASPMPEALLKKAFTLFPNCSFLQAYGMTELSPIATVLEPAEHRLDNPSPKHLRSAGRATFGVQLRIVDADGNEQPRGQAGEVVVKGENVMKGYWRQPSLTVQTIKDGWLHTGDMAYMDDDGFVYIVDRLKDMIISGGENIYSSEVENILYMHGAIAQCAVIGIPHSKWGETVHAIVFLKSGYSVDGNALIEHCRARMSHYKCPRSVEIRQEPLPVSGAGKILKSELRKQFQSV